MIENPGFPAKYGHWLKLFVWPVPFTSRPKALTGRKYFGSESLKGTNFKRLPENCQKTHRLEASSPTESARSSSSRQQVTGDDVGAEVGRHWFCPLVLPSSWWGRCCWWYVGCFQERHLDRAVASKTVAWELAQGITYPLLPAEQWKKTWLF